MNFRDSAESLPNPIVEMLLSGKAGTVAQAEELYLNTHLPEVLQLVDSPLSDEQFRRHPLIALLFSHGSRPLEDSLW